MKFEDLNIGAVIMHADRKENYAHTGEMWLVTKFRISEFEVICLNSSDPYRVGETGLILLKELPHYDLITTLCVPPATKPVEFKKDLWLRWAIGKKTSLGKVGDKTPYRLKCGRNLFVGDLVKISKAGEDHCGCPVVRDRTFGYVIMGIAASCNDRTGNIDDWNVSLESPFYSRRKGNIADAGYGNFDIEVIDFLPEEKE